MISAREMELSHQGGAEAESLLRPDQRAVVMPHGNRAAGWDGEGEKAPFLRNEPVRLTPAWEGSNLPNDTLNLKGVAMDLAPPKDKWRLIYMTIILHGFGTLTAWNMFITAKVYFEKYKLKDAGDISENFMVYIGYASQVPNFIFSWLNVFVVIGGHLETRIIISLLVEVLVFVFTIALAMMDSAEWQNTFFALTIVSVFVLNAFNSIYQNSVYGVAARLPPKYTGAVVLGSNICGTVVALLEWASAAAGGSPRTAAIYYFIGGMFVLLVIFDTYFALPLNRFYRYYDTLSQRALRVNPALAATQPAEPASPVPYGLIFSQTWVQLYNVFITFFVSLACFPAVQSNIVSTSGMFADNFTRVTCFLTFNVSAMLGSLSATFVQWPTRRWLFIFTTFRLVFIPLFLMCNYQVDKSRLMPVYITSDWVYWGIAAAMAWSSGHFSSLSMMYIGSTVAPEHSSKAGMLGAAMLITGILSGIMFSGFIPWRLVTASFWKKS